MSLTNEEMEVTQSVLSRLDDERRNRLYAEESQINPQKVEGFILEFAEKNNLSLNHSKIKELLSSSASYSPKIVRQNHWLPPKYSASLNLKNAKKILKEHKLMSQEDFVHAFSYYQNGRKIIFSSIVQNIVLASCIFTPIFISLGIMMFFKQYFNLSSALDFFMLILLLSFLIGPFLIYPFLEKKFCFIRNENVVFKSRVWKLLNTTKLGLFFSKKNISKTYHSALFDNEKMIEGVVDFNDEIVQVFEKQILTSEEGRIILKDWKDSNLPITKFEFYWLWHCYYLEDF